MITTFTIENFKAIRDRVSVDLRPVTLLFGPNSAGKSSVVHALAYARELLVRANTDPDHTLLGGEWLDLGGFENLVHGHDRGRPVRLGFRLDLAAEDLDEYLSEGEYYMLESTEQQYFPSDVLENVKEMEIRLTVRWSEAREAPLVTQIDYWANHQALARIGASTDGRDVRLEVLNRDHPIFIGSSASSLAGAFRDAGYAGDEAASPDDLMRVVDEIDVEGLARADTTDPGEVEPYYWFEDLLLDAWEASHHVARHRPAVPLVGLEQALPPRRRPLRIRPASRNDGVGDYGTFPLAFDTLIRSVLSGLLVSPLDKVADFLERHLHLGPLRQIPSRQPAAVKTPEAARWIRGEGAWDTLASAGDEFVSTVNAWLDGPSTLQSGYALVRSRFREVPVEHPLTVALNSDRPLEDEDIRDLLMSVPVKQRVTLRDETSGLELAPQDVGVGLSQLIPVIVASLAHRRGLLSVEQPELHVHPAMQVALGDLFLTQANAKGTSFLVETHSEHLLLRLLRRIREAGEGELPPGAPEARPDDVAVYYVEPGEMGATVQRLRIDESGDFLDEWPRGFFDERDPELF